ncbi:MAG: caspase family protein [Halobacteriota archaeon]
MNPNKPELYALLIGIDCYLPNHLPGGYYYPSLGGCVRDISHVEEFLRSKLDMPSESILKLTATNTGQSHPPEPQDQWPTYENMVAKLKQITSMAPSGAQVYIHYSGHGGRAKTTYSDLKGTDGLDEALVPTDIGNSEARYLRDVEMAYLLKAMVDKGLIVTVVLDSCHSGGATRALGGVARASIRRAIPEDPNKSAIAVIDTTERPTESQVASPEALKSTWLGLLEGTTRAVKPASGWLLEPQGYTLLAACRASESAYEFPFDGQENNGALTYWLLDSLKQIGRGLAYKTLHERILAKVHSQFEEQTPQLQGDGNREVFGSSYVRPYYAVDVLQVDVPKKQVMLGAGQAQGLRKGAQFAVYPVGTDLSQVGQRIALVEVTKLGATESWATITDNPRPDALAQGAQAVLFDPGDVRLQRAVRVLVDQAEARAQVESALQEGGSGFVRLAPQSEPADFQVAINQQNQYEIWDPAGTAIANLRPDIEINEQDAAARVVQRLVHLTKYRNVQELDNHDAMSPLARKLLVELTGVQSEYDPADKPNPKPFEDPGNTPTLKEGDWTFLRMRNNLSPGEPNDSSRILNVTVLDLQPDWGITQIYPSGAGVFEPLDPGQEITLPLQASLPQGYADGADRIKVFATTGTTNFRWLELPSLDQPATRSMTTRARTGDPLEELLAAVTVQEPATRNLNPAQYPSREWVAAQVEVRIRKV